MAHPPDSTADATLGPALLRALIPVVEGSVEADAQAQGIAFHQLVAAARAYTGPGADTGGGSFDSVNYTVAYRRLWRNPGSPKVYSRDEIANMAAALSSQGQLQPLTVAPYRDPRSRADGGTGGDLLIIDGALRYLGAAAAAWTIEEMVVTIKPLPTFYHVMLAAATVNLSVRPMTPAEARLYVRRLKATHRALCEAGVELPDLRDDDIAGLVGRDRTTIQRDLAIGELPDEVQLLLDTGRLTETQARELVGRSPRDAEHLAQEIATANATRTVPLTQRETRERVTRRREQTGEKPNPRFLFEASAETVADDLWCTELDGLALPLAIAASAHDLLKLLRLHAERLAQEKQEPDAAAKAALRALQHPTWEGFIASVDPSAIRRRE